jgi:hypothetical protein
VQAGTPIVGRMAKWVGILLRRPAPDVQAEIRLP